LVISDPRGVGVAFGGAIPFDYFMKATPEFLAASCSLALFFPLLT
jgi:hypothetical protein